MERKGQVLSIGQVRELKKLGFDVKKHSSMCYLPYYNSSLYKIDGYTLDTIERNDSFHSIPTMSIGDIIEVLPENIDNNFFLMFEKDYVTYNNRYVFLMGKEEKNLINALFETLKWCIKEKHIKL